MKKVISLVISLLIFISLTSCDAFQTTTNFVRIENLQEYVIVYSNQADVQVLSSIMTLRNTFINKYGIKLTSITDSNENGEKSPVILIGSTNRSESNKNLKYYDYAIEFVNDNIIINAGSNEALVSAVDWIIENCCGETFKIPEKYQSVGSEYPLADVTINGVKRKYIDVHYGETVNWSVAYSGLTTKSGSQTVTTSTELLVNLSKYQQGQVLFEKH